MIFLEDLYYSLYNVDLQKYPQYTINLLIRDKRHRKQVLWKCVNPLR